MFQGLPNPILTLTFSTEDPSPKFPQPPKIALPIGDQVNIPTHEPVADTSHSSHNQTLYKRIQLSLHILLSSRREIERELHRAREKSQVVWWGTHHHTASLSGGSSRSQVLMLNLRHHNATAIIFWLFPGHSFTKQTNTCIFVDKNECTRKHFRRQMTVLFPSAKFKKVKIIILWAQWSWRENEATAQQGKLLSLLGNVLALN